MDTIRNLIFIDISLKDFSSLKENLPEYSQYFEIDQSLDGVQQIADISKDYNDLISIQIVSHSDAGELTIGSTSLNNSTSKPIHLNYLK